MPGFGAILSAFREICPAEGFGSAQRSAIRPNPTVFDFKTRFLARNDRRVAPNGPFRAAGRRKLPGIGPLRIETNAILTENEAGIDDLD